MFNLVSLPCAGDISILWHFDETSPSSNALTSVSRRAYTNNIKSEMKTYLDL